ncbi:MAG TPA: low molecular weight protein arginine phosphatase [Peptostreptococcaceae bacterium]|nr:low molecular weight protein arginine phosphatase [Peptostreptococcaceae bacterium]
MNIVIVCTGNTCRSPMAESILKDALIKRGEVIDEFNITSAGISTIDGLDASKHSISALKEMNIDLKNHKSKLLTLDLVEKSDLILTMTKAHKDIILNSLPQFSTKIFTLKEFADDKDIDIVDPFGGSLEVYKGTAYDIQNTINKLIDKILQKKKDK